MALEVAGDIDSKVCVDSAHELLQKLLYKEETLGMYTSRFLSR